MEAARAARAFELEHAVLPFFVTGAAAPPTPVLAPITPLPPHVFLDLFVRHSTGAGAGAGANNSSGSTDDTNSTTSHSTRHSKSGGSGSGSGGAGGGGGGVPGAGGGGAAGRAGPAPEFAVRLQSVSQTAAPTAVSLQDLGLGAAGAACVETTLSMQQPRAANEAVRLRWAANETTAGGEVDLGAGAGAGAVGGSAEAAAAAGQCSGEITLDPLDIRAFVLTAN